MKSILLTGANGFIGGYIYDLLIKNRYNVFCLIKKKNSKINNYQISDLSKKITINKKISFDCVIHCASLSSSNNYDEYDFDQYYRDNILATKNLVDYANRSKIKKFIFLSSISIYGKINTQKLKLNSKIINPQKYGISKLISEYLVQDEKNYFNSISIRLPGVIGKFSKRNLLSELLIKIKLSKEIKIYNPNNLFNNCINVEDLSYFILKLINTKFSIHDVILLSTSRPIKIINIIQLLIKEFKSTSKIKIYKSKKMSFVIENIYANQKYRYKPKTTYETIKRYIKQNL